LSAVDLVYLKRRHLQLFPDSSVVQKPHQPIRQGLRFPRALTVRREYRHDYQCDIEQRTATVFHSILLLMW
jgi:hypothetical protein